MRFSQSWTGGVEGGADQTVNPNLPMFIMMGGQNSRSKVLAVITLTYEPGPLDIAKTPEEGARAAPRMLTQESKVRHAADPVYICQEMCLLFFSLLFIN